MYTITEKAASEIKRVISEKNLADNTMLRIGIAAGGCSGFQYSLGFDTESDSTKDDLTERYAQGEANAGLTGAGLGLSLVSAIAQKHGFTFSLKPVVGDAGEPSVRAEVLGPRRNGDA